MAQWKSKLADSSAHRMLDNDHPVRDIGTAGGCMVAGALLLVIGGFVVQISQLEKDWKFVNTVALGLGGMFSGLAVASFIRFPYVGRLRVYCGTLVIYGTIGFASGLFFGQNVISSLRLMFIFQVIGCSVALCIRWMATKSLFLTPERLFRHPFKKFEADGGGTLGRKRGRGLFDG